MKLKYNKDEIYNYTAQISEIRKKTRDLNIAHEMSKKNDTHFTNLIT